MELSVLSSLGIVDCAILLREKDARFSLVDNGGTWLSELLPNVTTQKAFDLNDASIFLTDFLIDAEDFWHKKEEGKVSSGIWTEQCRDNVLYLEAFASFHHQKCLLIIKNVEQVYHERKQTLQIARELHISNEAVIERHDYLTERLRAILIDNAQVDSRLPLHEAIKYAKIGIIITDTELNVQNVNPCAFDIFDQSDNMDQDYLLATLSSLVSRQYPEKDIFNGTKRFSGEVVWHMPPLASKWLNLNIHPVFSTTGRLSHWIISFSDQTRIKHLLQTNEELALHDSLTGLPNRQYFWQQIQHNIAKKEAFYLLSLDIVNFKYVNELYGYLEGDAVLKQVAKRLKSVMQENDFITRIGADEFMIIHKFTDDKANNRHTDNSHMLAEKSYKFAQAIYDACTQNMFTQDGRKCDLNVKLGLASFPQDANKAEQLMICADLALSFAKTNSKPVAPIQMYSESLKLASEQKILMEEALREAIELDELELYLQPIYNLTTKEVVKAEALLRWHHKGKIIYPDEFIPIAEASGSINAIGRWVIQRAIEIMNELENDGIKIPIAVNFSPKQIYDNKLISFIEEKIKEIPKQSARLEFELTENIFINNIEKVALFLDELKSLGISITIDDFGTGYCSLAYLKHLPIDALKIDRSFIQDVVTSDDDGAIVSAIIALAQKLNIRVVAEGVENKKQERFLLQNNCNIAQGFLYAKAVPLSNFKALMQTICK